MDQGWAPKWRRDLQQVIVVWNWNVYRFEEDKKGRRFIRSRGYWEENCQGQKADWRQHTHANLHEDDEWEALCAESEAFQHYQRGQGSDSVKRRVPTRSTALAF